MTIPASPTPPTGRKPNTKPFLFLGGGCVVIIFLLCVCSGSVMLFFHYHNSLVGKWKLNEAAAGDIVIIEFKSDGTCNFENMSGTYTTSGNKLTIMNKSPTTGEAFSETDEFEVDGNTLTITSVQRGTATVMHFTRQ